MRILYTKYISQSTGVTYYTVGIINPLNDTVPLFQKANNQLNYVKTIQKSELKDNYLSSHSWIQQSTPKQSTQ